MNATMNRLTPSEIAAKTSTIAQAYKNLTDFICEMHSANQISDAEYRAKLMDLRIMAWDVL